MIIGTWLYDQAIGPLLVRSTTVPLALPLSIPLTSTRTRLGAFWLGLIESIARQDAPPTKPAASQDPTVLPASFKTLRLFMPPGVQLLHRSHSSAATQSAHTGRPKPHPSQSCEGLVSHRMQVIMPSSLPSKPCQMTNPTMSSPMAATNPTRFNVAIQSGIASTSCLVKS